MKQENEKIRIEEKDKLTEEISIMLSSINFDEETIAILLEDQIATGG